MYSSDTNIITFDDVRVPVTNIIGEEGKGFIYQMMQFQEERLFAGAGGEFKVYKRLRRVHLSQSVNRAPVKLFLLSGEKLLTEQTSDVLLPLAGRQS